MTLVRLSLLTPALCCLSVMVEMPACYSQAASIDDLPEQVRDDFRKGLAEYEFLTARIELLESRSWPTAPVLERAKRELERARQLNDTTTPTRVRYRELYRGRGKDDYQRYVKWFRLSGIIAGAEAMEEISRDKDFRPFLDRDAFDFLTVTASGLAPQPGEWSDIKKLLPKDLEALTEEKAGAIWIKWLKQHAAEARKELEKLTPALDLDEKITRAAHDWNRAQSLVDFYRGVVKDPARNELPNLRKKADRAAEELTRLWPDWKTQ